MPRFSRGNPAGAMVPMPQTAPFYARSRLNPSENPPPIEVPENAMANRRCNGTAVERQYGLEYLRRKKSIRGFVYTFDGPPPFVVPAGGAQNFTVTIVKEADFELHKLACVVDVPALGIFNGRNDDFVFRLRDDRKQQYLMNQPIHNLCGLGSGVFPLVLPDTKFFRRSTAITMEVTNRRAAAAINVWPMFMGRNYYAREFENLTDVPDFQRLSKQEKEFFLSKNKKFIEPYYFTTDTTPIVLPALGTVQDTPINLRQDGDFEIFALTKFSSGPFTWSLRESGSGRQLTSGVVADGNVGDGERPMLFPEPVFIDAQATIFLTLTDRSGLPANNVFFTLIGRKWFDTASMNLTTGPEFYVDKYESI